MRPLRTLGGALIWLAVILVIALGAAGIVAGMDHPPGSDGRPDVTAAGDAEVTPMLDAANGDLSALADQVEALGTQARGALAALNSADPTTGEAAIATGDKLVADVTARTAALRHELAAVPYVGTPTAGLAVSDAVVQRHDRLVAALDATQGLDFAWARLTIGALAATKMSGLLASHDALVGQAADKGVHSKYSDALKLLGQAADQLDAARVIRNQLVDTVDVSVLDQWISRNAAYDTALGNLYKEISKVKGRITAATRAAVKAEKAARANLPPDTRGLVVIMADIGRGGMNGAVITIEEAKGKLSDALEADTPDSPDSPAPSSAP
ncbi:MAG TPA: hypothetical protein VGQ31_09295 [Candidatus Limnocylindrales bacterium]|nr:hypothetical protein [Candidatus Limnocylindrales bacterium]